MSYNITAWRIRTVHLTLPIDFDFQHWLLSQPVCDERGYENVGRRWCLSEKEECAIWANLAAHTWKLPLSGHELSGVIQDNRLLLSDIDLTGDGSGHIYRDILLPLFRETRGELWALVIWEGGESIYQLHVHDGVIEEKKVE